MLDRLDREIYIQVGPIEMMGGRHSHTHQLCDRRLAEPRELLERQKELAVPKKEPKAVLRNVGDFNR
jgi:hypothetical protein